MHFGDSNSHHRGCSQALQRAQKVAQKHGIRVAYLPNGARVLVDLKGNTHAEYDALDGIHSVDEAFKLIISPAAYSGGASPCYDDRGANEEVLATGLFEW